MKTKPFSELRKRMKPERRAKNKTRAQFLLLYLTLAELQESLGVTQDDISQDLEIAQSALSKLENQDDIQVSTLSSYIKALGGSLKIVADFPKEDKEIIIAQFE
ncbi:MAG: XRE family transcriptional regulator [Coleofasciculaceae cyanobacterium]